MGRSTGWGLPWLLRGERGLPGPRLCNHYGCPWYCSRKPCPKSPGQTGAAPHTPPSGPQPPPHPPRGLSCWAPSGAAPDQAQPTGAPLGWPSKQSISCPLLAPGGSVPRRGFGCWTGNKGGLLVGCPARPGWGGKPMFAKQGTGHLAGNGSQCRRGHPGERHRSGQSTEQALPAAEVPAPPAVPSAASNCSPGPGRSPEAPAAAVMDGRRARGLGGSRSNSNPLKPNSERALCVRPGFQLEKERALCVCWGAQSMWGPAFPPCTPPTSAFFTQDGCGSLVSHGVWPPGEGVLSMVRLPLAARGGEWRGPLPSGCPPTRSGGPAQPSKPRCLLQKSSTPVVHHGGARAGWPADDTPSRAGGQGRRAPQLAPPTSCLGYRSSRQLGAGNYVPGPRTRPAGPRSILKDLCVCVHVCVLG